MICEIFFFYHMPSTNWWTCVSATLLDKLILYLIQRLSMNTVKYTEAALWVPLPNRTTRKPDAVMCNKRNRLFEISLKRLIYDTNRKYWKEESCRDKQERWTAARKTKMQKNASKDLLAPFTGWMGRGRREECWWYRGRC